MELHSDDGSVIPLPTTAAPLLLGRATVAASADMTVSRQHLSLRALHPDVVSFQVIGKNPVLVLRGSRRRIYRPSEEGELRDGDSISLSLGSPRFYRVRDAGAGVREAVRRREERTQQRRWEEEEEVVVAAEEEEKDGIVLDRPELDPVRDFGFLVRGREFDGFPRQRVLRHARDWDWFLEGGAEAGSDGEEMAGRRRKKRRKGGVVDDDEVWTGESEGEELPAAGAEAAGKRKYSTRSRDRKTWDDDGSLKKPREAIAAEEIDEEDEEDETLGGFIVEDEEEEGLEEDEEEDEFDEEEEDE